MAAKFLIQGVQRAGHDGSWRAGRKWSSTAPTLVEVVDQEEDPTPEPGKTPSPHLLIGKKTFEALRGDASLRVLPDGDPLAMARASDNVEELRAQVERLTAENAALRAGGGGGPHSHPGNSGAENAGTSPTTPASSAGPSVPVGAEPGDKAAKAAEVDKHGRKKSE